MLLCGCIFQSIVVSCLSLLLCYFSLYRFLAYYFFCYSGSISTFNTVGIGKLLWFPFVCTFLHCMFFGCHRTKKRKNPLSTKYSKFFVVALSSVSLVCYCCCYQFYACVCAHALQFMSPRGIFTKHFLSDYIG